MRTQLIHHSRRHSGGGQAVGLDLCIGPDGEEYLFKEYSPEAKAVIRMRPLEALVRRRLDLGAADRAYLDRRCAWPRSIVLDGYAVQGVLMKSAPPEMFQRSTSAQAVVAAAANLRKADPAAVQDRFWDHRPGCLLGDLAMLLFLTSLYTFLARTALRCRLNRHHTLDK